MALSDRQVVVDECCFCNDLDNQNRALRLSREEFFNKLCAYTRHFGVFPSLSPLTKGHCLVIPRYHITSMSQIRELHVDECVGFLETVMARIKRALGNCVVFEHGVGAGRHGGCGVTHAHFHVLPMSTASMRHAQDRINNDYRTEVVRDLRELLRNGPVSSYLLFGEIPGPIQVTVDDAIPSQYLRRLISNVCDFGRWDWREYYGWNALEETRGILLTPVSQARS